jgi:hypothetical protein
MKTVFKVVREHKQKFVSAVVKDPDWQLQYEVGYTTTPELGMIYCFKQKSDAESWVNNIIPNSDFPKGKYHVLECEPRGRIGHVAIATWYKNITSGFWHAYNEMVKNHRSRWNVPHSTSSTPWGTVLCQSITPKDVIYSRTV